MLWFFCRTYVVLKGRIRAGCFTALRRVKKQEVGGRPADTLQCNIGRRAQTPHWMTHSFHDYNYHNGFTALGGSIGTPDSTDKDLAYVTELPILKYFRAESAWK